MQERQPASKSKPNVQIKHKELHLKLTWTIPSVAEVTGSEKSPPGGDTLRGWRYLRTKPTVSFLKKHNSTQGAVTLTWDFKDKGRERIKKRSFAVFIVTNRKWPQPLLKE